MKSARWAIALTLMTMALAESATAQSRRKGDEERRTEARQPASSDRGERRPDPARATTARVPARPAPAPRPRDEERARDRRLLGPVTVLSPRVDYDAYGRRYDAWGRYDRYDRYDRYGRSRVWGRHEGMSCLQLDDELDWAHDEWHYRNDRQRHSSWYDVEHARLELRIAEERAYSGCGRSREERDCRDRGRYPRTDDSLAIAIRVLDILLGDHDRARW